MGEAWVAVISVVIGGALTLAGQGLLALYQYHSERRRRDRDAALQAYEFVRAFVQRMRELPNEKAQFDDRPAFTQLTEDLRAQAIRISDETVRGRLLWIGSALSDIDLIERETLKTTSAIARTIGRWAEDVVGSYLRHEDQPHEPTEIEGYKGSIADAYAWLEEQAQLEQEERERRRRES